MTALAARQSSETRNDSACDAHNTMIELSAKAGREGPFHFLGPPLSLDRDLGALSRFLTRTSPTITQRLY